MQRDKLCLIMSVRLFQIRLNVFQGLKPISVFDESPFKIVQNSDSRQTFSRLPFPFRIMYVLSSEKNDHFVPLMEECRVAGEDESIAICLSRHLLFFICLFVLFVCVCVSVYVCVCVFRFSSSCLASIDVSSERFAARGYKRTGRSPVTIRSVSHLGPLCFQTPRVLPVFRLPLRLLFCCCCWVFFPVPTKDQGVRFLSNHFRKRAGRNFLWHLF